MSITPTTHLPKTRHPYIGRKKSVCAGKPVVIGTRIQVAQIAIEYERLGWSPDQIIEAHPHLRLPQVHDALSYYYENQKQIDVDILANEQYSVELRQRFLSRLNNNAA